MTVDACASWSFNVDRVNEWAYCTEVFTSRECDEIISYGLGKNLATATTVENEANNPTNNSTIRKGSIAWIFPTNDTYWMYRKLTDVITDLNNKFFNFDLFGITEPLQFTEYESNNGHYTKHIDKKCGFIIRKLSVVIQLTDPKNYDGGELVLYLADKGTKTIKERGSVIAFPSYILHEVTPVTRGTRHSLVIWVTGKSFI